MDPATVEALRRHERLASEQRLREGSGASEPRDTIFPAPRGGLLEPSAVGQRFQRLRRDADLPYIRLHDLRHTYATLALEEGIHPKIVSERLGHAGTTITLDLSAERAASATPTE